MSSSAFDTIASSWGAVVAERVRTHLSKQEQDVPIRVRHAADFVKVSRETLRSIFEELEGHSVLRSVVLPLCKECDEPVEHEPDEPPECDLCGKVVRSSETETCFFVISPVLYAPPAPPSPLPIAENNTRRSMSATATLHVTEDALKFGKIHPWESIREDDYLKVVTTFGGAEQVHVLQRLERFGFCLIRFQGSSPSMDRFLALEQWLGTARERQNDHSGKVKQILPQEAVEATTGDSAKELLPHVDGTQDHPLPPAMLAFEYETTPSWGGVSTFVDMAHVLLSMTEQEREEILQTLARPDAAEISKKGLTYRGPLIRAVCNQHAVSCRLRFDHVLKLNENYRAQFDRLQKAVLDHPRLEYSPLEGDIAIFDNWRVLHGRKAVGGRHLRFHKRMWIDDLLDRHRGAYLLGVRGIANSLLSTIAALNTQAPGPVAAAGATPNHA
jgi:alpha-ketoglutarate-dependent taurine dioxygenase